jgi:hypothetical protein
MAERDLDGRNQWVIAEFRAHRGRVGGYLVGIPLFLLTTSGAKSQCGMDNPAPQADAVSHRTRVVSPAR